jgi:hypothetical protein
MYENVLLHIGGKWGPARDGRTLDIVNPATEEVIGTLARAGIPDLDAALAAAVTGFATWRAMSAYERSKIMRKAAEILRDRLETVARCDRVVRRRGQAGLWPRYPGAQRQRVPAFGAGTRGRCRRIHAVEFPGQPGGAQGFRCTGRRLRVYIEGA